MLEHTSLLQGGYFRQYSAASSSGVRGVVVAGTRPPSSSGGVGAVEVGGAVGSFGGGLDDDGDGAPDDDATGRGEASIDRTAQSTEGDVPASGWSLEEHAPVTGSDSKHTIAIRAPRSGGCLGSESRARSMKKA